MRSNYCLLPLMLLCLVGGCQKEAQSLTKVENKEAPQEIAAPQRRVASPVYDGPFGLKQGLSIEQIEALGIKLSPSSRRNGLFYTDKLLKEHVGFQQYALVASETEGLCKLVAQSETIEAGNFGGDLQEKFNILEGQLKEVYGKNKRFDFLPKGSVWKEPQDWMMGLLKKDRVLETFWTRDEGSTLKNNIDAIRLEAVAESNSAGLIILTYEFDNHAKCKDNIEKKQKEAL